MPIILFALATALTLVSSRDVAGTLPFEIPVLRVAGTLSPSAGNHLYLVTLAVDEEGLFADDVNQFALVTSKGVNKPIGAGWNDVSIIPFDRIPMGREVGQVLPSDALLALERTSASTVTVELGPRGTIAFLFELPLDAKVRTLRLPDGKELAVP